MPTVQDEQLNQEKATLDLGHLGTIYGQIDFGSHLAIPGGPGSGQAQYFRNERGERPA